MTTGSMPTPAAPPELPDFSQFYTSRIDAEPNARGHQEAVLEAWQTAQDSWAAGSRYRIVDVIAVGGMGCILRAHDNETQRDVAMKVMLHRGGDAEAARRFIREARIVANLEHPNIVPIHDLGVSPCQDPYFTMKWVQGEDLFSILNRLREGDELTASKYRLRESLQIFQKICDAVAFAHSRNIVHLDLKPNNVMIGDFGEVIVLDWGLAKRLQAEAGGQIDLAAGPNDGTIRGTPGFMAPEQAFGELTACDARTDIFSLGAILYMILTHKCPIVGESPKEMIKHTRKGTIVPPGRRTFNVIPRQLEAVVMKAMAHDRQARYQSVRDLQQDIDAYLRGFATSAEAAGFVAQLTLLIKRNRREARLIVASAVVIVCLLTALVLVARIKLRPARDQDYANWRRRTAISARAEVVKQKAANDAMQTETVRVRQEAAYQRYLAGIRFAASCLADGRVARAADILDACPPSARHWEWYRLQHLLRLARTHLRPDVPVDVMALSSDGALLATGGSAPQAIIRRLHDVAAEQSLEVPDGVAALAFSGDGQRLLVADHDRQASVWSVTSGDLLTTLSGHRQAIVAIAADHSGRVAATSSDDATVRIWDVATGQTLRILPVQGRLVTVLAVSGDGHLLAAAGGDQQVRVWDLETYRPLLVLRGHNDQITAIAFAADGRLLATAGADGTIRLWDPRTGAMLRVLRGHSGRVLSLAISADSSFVISGGADGSTRLWDVRSGRQERIMQGHTAAVAAVGFDAGAGCLISAGRDRVVNRWQQREGQQYLELSGHRTGILAVAVSHDGELIATGGWDRTARLWRSDDGSEIRSLGSSRDPISAVCFLGGHRLFTGAVDGSARIWDGERGREIAVLVGHDDRISSVAASADGERLLTGSYDGNARLWATELGSPLQTFAAGQRVLAVALDRGSKRAATAGSDDLVVIWDAERGDRLQQLQLPAGGAKALAFIPGGESLLIGGSDGTARLFALATGQQTTELTGHADAITALAVMPDGQRAVTASRDGTVKLWQLPRGDELLTLRGHDDAVYAVAVTDDSQRIISAGADARALVWQAAWPSGSNLVDHPNGIPVGP